MMSMPQGNTGTASRPTGGQGQLPVISPGASWGGAPANSTRAGYRPSRGPSDVNNGPSDYSTGTRSTSDVVPAWYDSPTGAAPAVRSTNGTSSVPQWPYAPR
jgi:hypothetical protein